MFMNASDKHSAEAVGSKSQLISRPFAGRQQGLSMIEALVSLFVFSVGALGLAALQMTALSTANDTKQRSLVIWKAQELSDRIRLTKSADDPDGLLDEYFTAIGNDDTNIGVDGAGSVYTCPAVPGTRCADYTNTGGTRVNGAACTTAQLITYDIWETLCDPNSGLFTGGDIAEGSAGVQNLEIAMVESGDDYLLYFEWLARSADANIDLQEGGVRNVTQNLCGVDRNVDSRLDAYCVRIR